MTFMLLWSLCLFAEETRVLRDAWCERKPLEMILHDFTTLTHCTHWSAAPSKHGAACLSKPRRRQWNREPPTQPRQGQCTSDIDEIWWNMWTKLTPACRILALGTLIQRGTSFMLSKSLRRTEQILLHGRLWTPFQKRSYLYKFCK